MGLVKIEEKLGNKFAKFIKRKIIKKKFELFFKKERSLFR